MELVTSDAHQGLKNATAAVFTGASWQRCRTHFMANLLTRVPKRAQPGVATTTVSCHGGPHHLPRRANCLPVALEVQQPAGTARPEPAPERGRGGTEWWNNSALEPFPQVTRYLYVELPGGARPRQVGHPSRRSGPGLSRPSQWPTGRSCGPTPAGTAEPGDKAPQSLPPKGDVVGIFPNRLSARRLVGAVLAEQHDEWAEARRYLTIPNAAGNEALPTANMLDAAA